MFFHSFLIQFQNFLIEQFSDISEGYIRENGADYNVICHVLLLSADFHCKIKDFFFPSSTVRRPVGAFLAPKKAHADVIYRKILCHAQQRM